MFQAGCLWSLGDILAQGITHHGNSKAARERAKREAESTGAVVEKKSGGMPPFSVMFSAWDYLATLKVACFACFFVAPTASRFYTSLGRVFPSLPNGKLTPKIVAQRVASDQLIWAPILITSYLSYQCLMNEELSKVPEAITHRIGTGLLPIMYANWMVWCPVQTINFFLIPPQYWFLLVNAAAVPWTCYLAYKNVEQMENRRLLSEELKQIEEKEKLMKEYVASKQTQSAKIMR